MVLGWFGSEPPLKVSRPSSNDGPESHDEPAVTHFGAFSVESYTAVCTPVDELTVSAMLALWVNAPDVPVTVTVAAPTVAPAEAVNVSVEVALPLAGGVTGLVENAAVTPAGSPLALNVVAALKLFWLVMVTVLALFPPCVTVTEAGDRPMVKFGVAAAFTVRLSVALCVVEPDVPVIVTVAVPVVADAEAVSVSVEETLPPDAGVTGFGENAAVTPAGRPLALSVVAAWKPFKLEIVTVLAPLDPCVTDKEDGESAMLKSGDAVPPHPGNLKLLMRVFQLKLPDVFMYSCVYQNVQSSTGSTCIAL